ncbi:glycosyltransferase family 2 protein [Zavarzinella formosa]|uniref:glycosyltransferase family 2 protein n=1 Tax=Zavarzinella formosa TaxID=360055 RepID=UPI00031F47C7|nr:glycosyltransferase family 2 protein [Zavarzinella formosa]
MNPLKDDSLRLSVVIPSHSRPDLLELCLKSLQAHAPAETEIIVVDDGSTGEIISRTAALFAGVKILRHPKPLGFCQAANHGIMTATGEVVELLNDDTQVTAHWAESALRQFANPQIGSVAPLVLIGPRSDTPPTIDSAGDEYDLGGFARKRGHRELFDGRHAVVSEVFGASGSSAFYRRELLLRIGGYPSHFGAYFEDVDLSWRICHAGYRTVCEPASVVWHQVGSSHRKRRRLFEQQSRNEERVFWRNVPNLRRSLPRHAAVLMGKSLRRIREGTFWPFAFGRLRALAELPAHFRHRRAIKIAGH